MAVKLIKDLYTATVQVTGGRRGGIARSSDKILDLPLQAPRETGGPGGATNPEQLFAAAYAACYTSALGVVARERKHALGDTRVTADVTLGTDSAGRYGIRVALTVEVPDTDKQLVQELAEAAHEVCPFSRAIAGNTEVTTQVR
ncbi:MAG TPA: Ohr family peroxiredoxin [Natronosporangium sp.]|nr:Ohr family peroxiredoxin [Natronosporangium sp.]